MSDPVILHGYYRSSASFRVRIALNLKAIAYDVRVHAPLGPWAAWSSSNQRP
jgi:glutathione S-transferase